MPVQILSYLKFPPEAVASIVSAEALAERDFRAALSDVRLHDRDGERLSHTERARVRTELTTYASRAVLAFAKQACQAALSGHLQIDHVAGIVDGRIEVIIHHGYYDLVGDRATDVWREQYACLCEIRDRIKDSEGWHEFLTTLDAAASEIANRLPATKDAVQNWKDIEIRFLSDRTFQATIQGQRQEPKNYAEAGFSDSRSNKPRAAWDTLRALAESDGVISSTPTSSADWGQLEKRIQEIRKFLKAFFHIDADPVPYVDGVGYQTQFKIGVSASYER